MSYDNDIIRNIADVAVPTSPREIAVADSQKVKYISLDTLKVTASELGLEYAEVDGRGEDGEENVYLIVAKDRDTVMKWEIELFFVNMFGTTSKERMRFQIRMGQALGYSSADIIEFLPTEVAKTCPCTCCGGTP